MSLIFKSDIGQIFLLKVISYIRHGKKSDCDQNFLYSLSPLLAYYYSETFEFNPGYRTLRCLYDISSMALRLRGEF